MLPSRLLRGLTLLVGLGAIYGAFSYGRSSHEDALGQALLIILPFGITMIALALSRPSGPGSVEGVAAAEVTGPGYPVRATVFGSTQARGRAHLAGLGGFATIGVGMALFPGGGPNTDETLILVLGIGIALGFGSLFVLALRSEARGVTTVALTPTSIFVHGWLRRVEVEWDELSGVDWYFWRAVPTTILRRPGRDVHIPLQMLGADPHAFHALVVHMHAHREDRQQLAHPGGAEVLRRFGVAEGA